LEGKALTGDHTIHPLMDSLSAEERAWVQSAFKALAQKGFQLQPHLESDEAMIFVGRNKRCVQLFRDATRTLYVQGVVVGRTPYDFSPLSAWVGNRVANSAVATPAPRAG
jgi:hypothetical protein